MSYTETQRRPSRVRAGATTTKLSTWHENKTKDIRSAVSSAVTSRATLRCVRWCVVACVVAAFVIEVIKAVP